MEFFNSLNLKQIKGGTKLKQGDLGSVLSYSLTDENGQEITSFDNKTAYINLVLDDKIWFTTTTLVDISRVTFRIDKAIPIGLYYLEIKIDDYIFPSDRDSIILIEEGSTPYDLKELVPNYDINMTLKGILSDLSQKGIDISDLKTKMNAIYNNALADHAEITTARGTHPNLKSRLDNVDKKQNQTTAQLAQKANKDEVTNVMTPKGTLAYASLPMTGNSVGWYYYCPDGDGSHGAGNYVWNGTSWFFGGTGDEGYNLLKSDFAENYVKRVRGVNQFNPDNAVSGFIGGADGVITPSDSYSTTDFIPVKAGEPIAFQPRFRKLLAYDSSKRPIPSTLQDKQTFYTYTPDADGFIRASFYEEDADTFMVYYGNGGTAIPYESFAYYIDNGVSIFTEENVDKIRQYADEEISRIQLSGVTNKFFVGFGDSIMYGAGNYEDDGNRYPFVKMLYDTYGGRYRNESVGGATFGTSRDNNIPKQVDTFIGYGSYTPDFAIFNGGTNDISPSTKTDLGIIMKGYDISGIDKTTFSGGMEYVIGTLKKTYPNCKLLYIRCHNMDSRNADLQKTYGQRALEICEKWGVRVADVYKYGGMNTNLKTDKLNYTYDTYNAGTGDGTHPNRKGYIQCYLPVVRQQLEYM